MLRLLLLISLTMTSFLLFISSFFATMLDNVLPESLLPLFEDVRQLNPFLNPTDIVVGTLLSYFVVTALFVIMLRVSKELKEEGDIYALDAAIIEGITAGFLALIAGFLLRLLGLREWSNVVVPLAIFLFGARADRKRAAVVSGLFVLLSLLAYFTLITIDVGELITPLYYLFLILAPPLLVRAAYII